MENFKVLNELFRKAYDLISPITYHDDVDRLTPEFVQQDSKKNPGCYLSIDTGSDHTIFPICNRYGYKCPKMINFSLKLAKGMAKSEIARERDMTGAIIQLKKLHAKYSKEVPNTMSQAVLKGKSTKRFNRKMQLNSIMRKNEEHVDLFHEKLRVVDKEAVEGALKKSHEMGIVRGSLAGVGGTVLAYELYKGLKSLYKKFKAEKDPTKKDILKAKIKKQKDKIQKAKKKK